MLLRFRRAVASDDADDERLRDARGWGEAGPQPPLPHTPQSTESMRSYGEVRGDIGGSVPSYTPVAYSVGGVTLSPD